MEKLITKDIFLTTDNLNLEKVYLPEFDTKDEHGNVTEKGFVYVRQLSGSEQDRFEESFFTRKRNRTEHSLIDARARFAVLVCCDEKGQAIFTKDDVHWLTRKSAKVLSRIWEAGKKLNEISDEDEEELVKNFK